MLTVVQIKQKAVPAMQAALLTCRAQGQLALPTMVTLVIDNRFSLFCFALLLQPVPWHECFCKQLLCICTGVLMGMTGCLRTQPHSLVRQAQTLSRCFVLRRRAGCQRSSIQSGYGPGKTDICHSARSVYRKHAACCRNLFLAHLPSSVVPKHVPAAFQHTVNQLCVSAT